MIPARPSPPPKIGDVAAMASVCERLDRIKSNLDTLVEMMNPVAAVFSDKSMRVAIGAASTSQSLKVRK